MGVNYSQHCIIGFKVAIKDLEETISEEQFEMQPRYDVNTGKKISEEKVIIKKRQFVYKLLGFKDKDIYTLAETVAATQSVVYYISDDNLYIGFNLIRPAKDYSRVSLLDSSVPINVVKSLYKEMQERFPSFEDNIEMHFISDVG